MLWQALMKEWKTLNVNLGAKPSVNVCAGNVPDNLYQVYHEAEANQ